MSLTSVFDRLVFLGKLFWKTISRSQKATFNRFLKFGKFLKTYLRNEKGPWTTHQAMLGLQNIFSIFSFNDMLPAGFFLLKVNNRNTTTTCEICSKLTIKMTSLWCLYCWLWTYFALFTGASIVNFVHVLAVWGRSFMLLIKLLPNIIKNCTF